MKSKGPGGPRSGRMATEVTLTVTGGPAAGKRLTAARPTLVVGRSPGADLTLDDPRVSLLHLQIAVRGDEVSVRDLASRLLVNGQRVPSAVLQDQDRLGIGDSEIRVGIRRGVAATARSLPLAGAPEAGARAPRP